jgi:hypothetical protein
MTKPMDWGPDLALLLNARRNRRPRGMLASAYGRDRLSTESVLRPSPRVRPLGQPVLGHHPGRDPRQDQGRLPGQTANRSG